MGIGGALAVGGAAYLIWAATTGPSDTTTAVRPWIAPGLAGGDLSLSF